LGRGRSLRRLPRVSRHRCNCRWVGLVHLEAKNFPVTTGARLMSGPGPLTHAGQSGSERAALSVVEATIDAAGRNQFVMPPLFDDTRLVHHHDSVGMLAGGQAMGGDQCPAALREVRERLLYRPLRFG